MSHIILDRYTVCFTVNKVFIDLSADCVDAEDPFRVTCCVDIHRFFINAPRDYSIQCYIIVSILLIIVKSFDHVTLQSVHILMNGFTCNTPVDKLISIQHSKDIVPF